MPSADLMTGRRPAAPAAAGRSRSAPVRRLPVGLIPFLVYAAVFLGLPAGAVAWGAFERPGGGFTLANIRMASQGTYRRGFETSVELSVMVAVVSCAAGLLVAMAVHRAPAGSLLRRMIVTASGVFANFGGVPLAFIFVATLGTSGFGTRLLSDLGFRIYSTGFNLYAMSGLALVYLYWEIPLMVLVILPALETLAPQQREAASNLGADGRQYWRLVGMPVLLPSVAGAALLLFASSFSAYATAEALTSGSVPLSAIQIGSFLSGNVIAGQENVGKALGLGMIVVGGVVMIFYTLLQRRVSRWMR